MEYKDEQTRKALTENPSKPTNVSMDELEQVLNDYGFERDHATGSHYIFRYNLNGKNLRLAIPYRKPIKAIYVKESIAVIDQIRAAQEETENGDQEP